MKKIPLTQGKFALVDDEDFEYLTQKKWYFCKGYAFRHEDIENIWMHRLINNTPEGMETDHIDGNKLNNQKSNLRTCSSAQNKRNAKKTRSKTSSQFKGVCYRERNRKWMAYIAINKKWKYLGLFFSEIEAAKVYNTAAIKFHGEYARLNKAVQETLI